MTICLINKVYLVSIQIHLGLLWKLVPCSGFYPVFISLICFLYQNIPMYEFHEHLHFFWMSDCELLSLVRLHLWSSPCEGMSGFTFAFAKCAGDISSHKLFNYEGLKLNSSFCPATGLDRTTVAATVVRECLPPLLRPIVWPGSCKLRWILRKSCGYS